MLESLWPNLLAWSWIGLLAFIGVFVGTPFRYGKQDFIWQSVTNQNEKDEYKGLKNHTMTLAGFTTSVIAIIIALPSSTGNEVNRLATFYFSIALVCFFSGSYLFDYRVKRVFPYLGQVGEYTGILSLGLGFLSFANAIFVNDVLIISIYIIFMISIILIAVLEIYYNRKFFEPDPNDKH